MLRITETRKLAAEAVQPGETFPLLAAATVESGFTQAAPTDVKTVAPVGAVTGLVAVLAVFADGTLLAASWGEAGGRRTEDTTSANFAQLQCWPRMPVREHGLCQYNP